jgi:hypothetical protein
VKFASTERGIAGSAGMLGIAGKFGKLGGAGNEVGGVKPTP